MKKVLALWLCYSCSITILWAQKVDSLRKILQKPDLHDTLRVISMADLSIEYRNTHKDSSWYLAQEALQLSKSIGFMRGQGMAYRSIGLYYYIRGDYRKALSYYQTALPLLEKSKNTKDIAWIYTNIGTAYRNLGNYDLSLDNYYKSLQNFEKIQDFLGMGWTYGNIGIIYGNQDNFEKALEYHQKSLEVRLKTKSKADIALSYSNIGALYYRKKDYKRSLENHLKSKDMYERINDKVYSALSCMNIGKVYIQTKNTDALVYLEKGLQLAQETKSKGVIAEIEIALAQYFNSQNQFRKAQERAKEALDMSQKMGQVELIRAAAEQLSIASSYLKDYETAYQALSLFKKMDDSLSNETNQKKALQRDFVYKEEKQRLEQEKKDLAFQAQIRQQRFWLYASLGGVALLLGIVFFAIKAYKTKQSANKLLEAKQIEILTQNEELLQSQEEISAQRDFIELRNQELAEFNRRVTSSIVAAQMIQEALTPYQDKINRLLPQFLSIYRPRDVVSGDFFWLNKIEDKTVLFVADCTGHGVPGAFMTLLGNTLLDKIIKMWGVLDPVQILTDLDKEVKITLRQKYTNNNSGMDANILIWQESTKQIQWVGAKQNLYYQVADNPDVMVIKGTRRSIGGEQNEKNVFTTHEMSIYNTTRFYLTTDGFLDQNDKNRKRLGENKFMGILKGLYGKSLPDAKIALETALDDHMLGTTQRDDILLIAIELS